MKQNLLALWAVAVFATSCACVTYLSLRNRTVRLGYELEAASKVHRQRSEQLRMLALEAQTLREHARVQAIAERTLGMVVPDKSRIVAIGGAARAQYAAGRVR
jgi:cell division protein FtsL